MEIFSSLSCYFTWSCSLNIFFGTYAPGRVVMFFWLYLSICRIKNRRKSNFQSELCHFLSCALAKIMIKRHEDDASSINLVHGFENSSKNHRIPMNQEMFYEYFNKFWCAIKKYGRNCSFFFHVLFFNNSHL